VDWSILVGLVSLFSEDGLDGVELLVFELVVLVLVFVLVRENEDDEALLDDDVDCSRELTRWTAWLSLSLLIISTSWSSLICSVSSSFLALELSSCFGLKPNSMSNLFTFGLVLWLIVELGVLDGFSCLLLDSAEFELHVN
jgi:hypothetical protein